MGRKGGLSAPKLRLLTLFGNALTGRLHRLTDMRDGGRLTVLLLGRSRRFSGDLLGLCRSLLLDEYRRLNQRGILSPFFESG
jgi:hypothetical protein